MSFEPFPGVKLCGPSVPDDLSGLMHSCAGPNCTFCTWRRENLIELGWERLLEPEACSTGSTLCGVDLTSSQMLDPSCELSTQQVTGYLANLNDEKYFPHFDAEFEQVLTQVEKSTSQYVTASTTCTASVTMASTTVTSTSVNRVYAFPKGKVAVQSTRDASIPTSIPTKTKKNKLSGLLKCGRSGLLLGILGSYLMRSLSVRLFVS